MKLRTTAQLISCAIDGESLNLENPSTIELEFSAIDTGGGFKDPILDFSFAVDLSDISEITEDKKHTLIVELSDPDKDNEVKFSHEGTISITENDRFVTNGRLKEDQLSDKLIGFVMKRLQ